MLTETNGDLWDYVGERKIVVTTNCIGVMGAGIAKQCREMYPGIEDRYKAWLKSLSSTGLKSEPTEFESYPDVILVPTKYHWTEDADLELIRRNIMDMSVLPGAFAIPELGCGLGNLKWEQVESYYKVLENAIGDWLVVHPKEKRPEMSIKGFTHVIIAFNNKEDYKVTSRIAEGRICFGSDTDYIVLNYFKGPNSSEWIVPRGHRSPDAKGVPGLYHIFNGKLEDELLIQAGRATDLLKNFKIEGDKSDRKFFVTEKNIYEIKDSK